LSLTAVAFFVSLLAPESPKYLYSYKKYKESRKALEVIAKLNRVDTTDPATYKKYLFDTEWTEITKSRTTIPIIPSQWKNSNNNNIMDDNSNVD